MACSPRFCPRRGGREERAREGRAGTERAPMARCPRLQPGQEDGAACGRTRVRLPRQCRLEGEQAPAAGAQGAASLCGRKPGFQDEMPGAWLSESDGHRGSSLRVNIAPDARTRRLCPPPTLEGLPPGAWGGSWPGRGARAGPPTPQPRGWAELGLRSRCAAVQGGSGTPFPKPRVWMENPSPAQ